MNQATHLLTVVLVAALLEAPAQSQEIQSWIDAAGPGDTVVVPPGTWTGNIALRVRTTLIGLPGATVRGDGTGSCIVVLADSCVIEGLVIEHSGSALAQEHSGILLRSDGNRVRNNRLRDILFGVYLYQSDDNVISNNEIAGRAQLSEGERGSGVHIWDSYRNRLTDNTIHHMRDGFYFQNASHSWIEGNEVFALRYGLHYMYADSNTFVGNRFHDNVAGAAVMYSHGIVMRRNTFLRNRGFSSYGILFQDCHGMKADSNLIVDNVVGMFFEASSHNDFRYNIIAQNDIALKMFQNSDENLFAENAFIDNLIPLSVVGKRTTTRWSLHGRGNYWSDYDGYDLDSDGVGDVPQTIQNAFDYLEGRQPAFRLYLYSTASKALAAATKAFPILQLSSERDPAPLMRPITVRRSQSHASVGILVQGRRASVLPWLLTIPLVGMVIVIIARRRTS